MLKTYPFNGIDVQINALNGYAFQLTNSFNELVANDSDFSNIDLGECERLIKQAYEIDQNLSLIFFKFEHIASSGKDRDIQYEIYNPITYEQLNLSICLNQNKKLKISIPIELSEELIKLLKNIIDQGYDPLNLNDKFYREICTPYNSENGTDVLLDDREEYIYSTIESEMSCPSGCQRSSYSLDDKYITCECDSNDIGIVPLDIHHLSGKNVLNSVLSTLKNSNYKVMRCYNLVFNFKIFCRNYGSIITLIFFIIYVVFMIYFILKDITPIKVSISKLVFEEQLKDNLDQNQKPFIFKAKSEKNKKATKSVKSSKSSKKKKQTKNKKNFYPPKKVRVKRTQNNNNSFEKKKGGGVKLIDIVNKRYSIKNKPQPDKESVKSDKVRQRKSIIDYQNELIIKTRDNLIDIKNQGYGKGIDSKMGLKSYDSKNKPTDETMINDKGIKDEEIYDNYELNNMGYFDASDFDKRSCLRTYWSVILREHFVIFTFISKNDFNLFYVKIERFFILICTELTMNGMFFVHETMYKKKTGGLTFAEKIPQIIFSLLVSHTVEIILCFLGMTDTHYYEIKELYKSEKNKLYGKNQKNDKDKNIKSKIDDRIFEILNKIKKKLIAFFIFTFLLFLFHWYFISAFCAVYQNTQLIFLRDSAIAILTALIDPFIIYGIKCILRLISLLKGCRKKLVCLYKISELIPIF